MHDPPPRRRFAPIRLTAVARGGRAAPFDAPRPVSMARPPTQGTVVQSLARHWLASGDGRSGFAPLTRGSDALGARIRLIDAAQCGIDLQSFLVKPNLAARLLTLHLIAAADRGVRVRILVDDIFTTASDRQLAVLDARPMIEVRIFNPLARGVPRLAGFLAGLPRSNRRMHNKSFTVDNAITIVGGRNLADEYYEIDRSIEFADFDMLCAGPAAADVSSTFDQFWNSDHAVPLSELARPGKQTGSVASPILEPEKLAAAQRYYEAAVNSPFLESLRRGDIAPETAPAHVVTDRPAKLHVRRGVGEQVLVDALTARLAAARREVVFVTPYFVPRADGVARLIDLRTRGVEVTVITNSLASTNQPVVHGGYAPYRRALLEAGVRLFEARPDSVASRFTDRPVRLTLHAKVTVIDRRLALIGSLNLDPRSMELNSEMGIFIESPAVAGRLADAIDAKLPLHAYALRLDETGRLVWETGTGTDRHVWYSDPGASLWRTFVARLVALLPLVENQL